MNYYRLLRDNKESGPYSQDELIVKGFKPYDLIWVEGRSAGWRYPSEITELKPFAPVIEEQPYDRFYKKPAPQKAGNAEERNNSRSSSFAATAVKKEEVKTEYVAPVPAYTVHTSPVGKHIHVTLPSGNVMNVTTIHSKKEDTEEKKISSPATVQPIEERKPSFTETISQPSYSNIASLENITTPKEAGQNIYVGTNTAPAAYQYPAQTSAAGFSWTMLLGLFVGIATLIGLGILIGLSINRGQNDTALNTTLNKNTKQKVTAGVAGNTSHSVTKEENKIPELNQNPQQTLPEENKELARNVVIKSTVPPINTSLKETKKDNNKPEESNGNPVVSQQPVPVIKKSDAVPAASIEKQLNITTNGYKVGAFGGISDLQCTLVNDSKFALDMVEVEVQYIQANDKVYKTETLTFKDIAAGAQATLSAPKSPRGVKVSSKIIRINSKDPGLSNITVKS